MDSFNRYSNGIFAVFSGVPPFDYRFSVSRAHVRNGR
jgi:hypothetical protein